MALVRQHLGEQLSHGGHRLQEDARLQRGECRIDGQGAQVDATLETRWRRVLESIGHDRARWQVPDEDAANADQGGEAPACATTRCGATSSATGGVRWRAATRWKSSGRLTRINGLVDGSVRHQAAARFGL